MELKDKYFKVLDDGFIALKDYMGSDEDIERSARVSYGKGTRKTSDTRNLIRYLMRHKHTSPFEFPQLVFHVRAPIYIYRQWHRHRTWSYNEYSARYSEMIDSMEKTSKWRIQSTTNKQGSQDGEIKHPDTFDCKNETTPEDYLSEKEQEIQQRMRNIYEERLVYGVAREQARKDMPVSNYSEMYATVNLHNLFHFMSLRCDSHAQQEIREYANIIASIVKEIFPISFEAWYDYNFCASNLTLLDKKVLQKMLSTSISSADLIRLQEEVGMSKREIEEFKTKIRPAAIELPDLLKLDCIVH